MVQLELAGMVPPVSNVTVDPPAVPVLAPEQLPPIVPDDSVRFGGSWSTSGLDKVAIEA